MDSRAIHCFSLLVFVIAINVFSLGGCKKENDMLDTMLLYGGGSGTGGTGTGSETGTGTVTGTGTDTGGTGSITGTGTGTGTDTGDIPVNSKIIDVYDRINEERTNRGLNTLLYNNELADVADWYAGRLQRAHTTYYNAFYDGKTPEIRISEAGIEYIKAGECGYINPSGDTTHPFDGMMEDYSHVLMDPDFTHVGIGYRYANG
ncbi:MAG: CAP domain-containing protein [Planctomycetota bacterium]|jgi:uncharacterized protein YkwD